MDAIAIEFGISHVGIYKKKVMDRTKKSSMLTSYMAPLKVLEPNSVPHRTLYGINFSSVKKNP